ncbi:hypothetical protein ACFVFS_32850 [Kitasatospora sp. NPDC057692]|uniref:restriction system modified-DNA reader domain-containing protein n=1 Tax=Kitasatospora sp. NPDC057692 TaxID=3346215 RepID=UPI00367FBEF8
MRHVDASRLKVPPEWRVRANELEEEVKKCAGDKAKLRKIFKRAAHWRGLRPALVDMCGRKCWYCEGEIANSRPHVDHFRPKGRVLEDVSHTGYYWLAYDPTNFRLACEYCNSSTDDDPTGSRNTKHDHFPLLNESSRICSPGGELSREMPVLLDPLIAGDSVMLAFDRSGVPRRSELTPRSPLESVDRVTESIRIYGLDRTGLLNGRERVMQEVSRMATALDILPWAEESIRDRIAPNATYSSAAWEALRMARGLAAVRRAFHGELEVDKSEDDDDDRSSLDRDLSLPSLIELGALKPGVELIGSTGIGEFSATLLADGRIELGARAYASPESAAAAAGAEVSSGWQFWTIEVNSGRVPIAEIRDAFALARSRRHEP